MAGLPHDEGNSEQQVDGERKDLRAKNGPADFVDRIIAPAQLRTPPHKAWRRKRNIGNGFSAGAPKGGCDERKLSAGAAAIHVRAQFRRAGLRPLASLYQFFYFGFAGAGAQHPCTLPRCPSSRRRAIFRRALKSSRRMLALPRPVTSAI